MMDLLWSYMGSDRIDNLTMDKFLNEMIKAALDLRPDDKVGGARGRKTR